MQAVREVRRSAKGCESNKTTCDQAWREGILEEMASMLRPKRWLGMGWATRKSRERILEKGGRTKGLRNLFGWKLNVNQVATYTWVM